MSEIIFQKSLTELIKGLRKDKNNESSYIAQSIIEIKEELHSKDPYTKAEAVKKLTYLHMIGCDISWAAFNILEVMSSAKFEHKRIGFLAGNQSFTEKTDVLMLTTNLLKRLFGTANKTNGQTLQHSTVLQAYEIGLGINALSNIINGDLAKDCIGDMVLLMKHPNPYVRKKAILVMYKVYLKYPQGLRLTYDVLVSNLEDSNLSVASTAVNVICELANKNPRNFLQLAPSFFNLLKTTTNNWLLIKIVKLFSSLVSEEPKLARKLLDPLTKIVLSTSAKSLQYECIYTITQALQYSRKQNGSDSQHTPAAIQVCVEYLTVFIEEKDPNLQYLGLVGSIELLKSCDSSIIMHNKSQILKCLSSDDITIKKKTLTLISALATKETLIDLVNHLLVHAKLADGLFKVDISNTILDMCCKSKYARVIDFEWLVLILVSLSMLRGQSTYTGVANISCIPFRSSSRATSTISLDGVSEVQNGDLICNTLVDISVRVAGIRPFLIQRMLQLLICSHYNLESGLDGSISITMEYALKAAAWILGEYCDCVTRSILDAVDVTLHSTQYNVHVRLLNTMLHPSVLTQFQPSVQMVYIQSAIKIFIHATGSGSDHGGTVGSSIEVSLTDLSVVIMLLRQRLKIFMEPTVDIEVQERVNVFRRILEKLGILPPLQDDLNIDPISTPDGDPSASVDSMGHKDKGKIAEPPEEDLLLMFLDDDYHTADMLLERNKQSQRQHAAFSAEESVLDHLFHTPMCGTVSDQNPADDVGTTACTGYSNIKGAEVARAKHKLLQMFVAENFYTVHPQAQVSVPLSTYVDEKGLEVKLDLDTPVNRISFEAWRLGIVDAFSNRSITSNEYGHGKIQRRPVSGAVERLTLLGGSIFSAAQPPVHCQTAVNTKLKKSKSHRLADANIVVDANSDSDTAVSPFNSHSITARERRSTYHSKTPEKEEDTSVFYLGGKRPGHGTSSSPMGTGINGDKVNLLDDLDFMNNSELSKSYLHSHVNVSTGTTSYENNAQSIFDTLGTPDLLVTRSGHDTDAREGDAGGTKKRSKEKKKSKKSKDREEALSNTNEMPGLTPRANPVALEMEFDKSDMLPAGVTSISNISNTRASLRHNRNTSVKSGSHDELSSIDVTRPLSEGEVLPVLQHRIVPTNTMSNSNAMQWENENIWKDNDINNESNQIVADVKLKKHKRHKHADQKHEKKKKHTKHNK